MVPRVRIPEKKLQLSAEVLPALTRKLTAEVEEVIALYVNGAVATLDMVKQLKEWDPTEPFELTENFVRKYCPGMLSRLGFVAALPKKLPVDKVRDILRTDVQEALNEANADVTDETGETALLIDVQKFMGQLAVETDSPGSALAA